MIEPTHLKNYGQVKWILSPRFGVKNRKISELPPPRQHLSQHLQAQGTVVNVQDPLWLPLSLPALVTNHHMPRWSWMAHVLQRRRSCCPRVPARTWWCEVGMLVAPQFFLQQNLPTQKTNDWTGCKMPWELMLIVWNSWCQTQMNQLITQPLSITTKRVLFKPCQSYLQGL